MSILTKTCSQCCANKPLDYFFADKRRDGYRAQCKVCTSAKGKAYRASVKATPEYKEKNKLAMRKWRTRYPEYYKTWYAKNPDRARASVQRYRSKPENRAKAHAANKAWRESNAEHEREMYRQWQDRNRDKTRIYAADRRALKRFNGGKLSPDITNRLMKQQREKCVYCGQRLTSKNRHLDHIQPLIRGGLHADANIQLLCRSCNLSKKDRDPIAFAQSRGLLL